MPSALTGYECDIFISYRQNDNLTGWVSEFVDRLQQELAATIKDPVSVYFDSNPHDGLLEMHHVDKSLESKLRCVIFLPIISRTYCDPKSFAWNNELLPFLRFVQEEELELHVHLENHNVASRILPIQIHDIDSQDRQLFESQVGIPLRPIEFIFNSPGVSRPLMPPDSRTENSNHTYYRDQINKVANAVDQIMKAAKLPLQEIDVNPPVANKFTTDFSNPFWQELKRRNVIRAGISYSVISLFIHQFVLFLTPWIKLEQRFIDILIWVMVLGLPAALLFAWFYEVSPQGFIRIDSDASVSNPFPPEKRKPFTSKPIVSVWVILFLVQYLYLNYLKAPEVVSSIDSEGNRVIKIAVLPFENRGGANYIAEGITDDIINRLIMIRQFRVTNEFRSSEFKGNLISIENIAKELQVSVLLRGSVSTQDGQMAIRAQLIDQNDNFIWSNTYYRTPKNIIALQSEIAQTIAEQLRIQLSESEKTQLFRKATENPTAYDLYHKGRSLYYKYDSKLNDSAAMLFRQAIEIDSNYARAWAGLSDAYAQRYGRFVKEYYWTDSSLVAGNRAIQLDSGLSEAYKALATAYDYREDYESGYPLLVKAVALDPTDDRAIGNLGTNYMLRGDLPSALKWQKKAGSMNPKNWIPYQLTGWVYRLLGDLENAEQWLKKSFEFTNGASQHDTYELLAYTLVAQGRSGEALELIPRVLEIGTETRVFEAVGLIAHFSGNTGLAKEYFQQSIDSNQSYKEDHYTASPIGLGQILLNEGNHVEAEVYLNHALENNLYEVNIGSKSFEPPFYLASIYAIKGNRTKSIEWLKRAIDMNWVDYVKFTHGPYFHRYKNDPEFLLLIDSLKRKVQTMRQATQEN